MEFWRELYKIIHVKYAEPQTRLKNICYPHYLIHVLFHLEKCPVPKMYQITCEVGVVSNCVFPKEAVQRGELMDRFSLVIIIAVAQT